MLSDYGGSELTGGQSDAEASDGLSEAQLRDVIGVAEVVYPSAVTGIPAFVTTYVTELPASRTAGVRRAIEWLNGWAQARAGSRPAELSASERAILLRSYGVNRVDAEPTGTVPEQIRYFVVNELLYALFTSPAGSSLVGVDNPVGHPGGYDDYQEGPTDE